MALPVPPPGPERDRRIAAQPRYGARRASEVGEVVDAFLDSDEARRMRRFQRVAGALKRAIDPRLLAKVRPVLFKSGVLTLDVDDTVAMNELRQHYAPALMAALVADGTGVSRLAWRLRRSR